MAYAGKTYHKNACVSDTTAVTLSEDVEKILSMWTALKEDKHDTEENRDKALINSFLKDDMLSSLRGESHKLIQAHANTFNIWYRTESNPCITSQKEDHLLADLKGLEYHGDYSQLDAFDMQVIKSLSELPLFSEIYVFKNEITDFWVVLSEHNYKISLEYTRTFMKTVEKKDGNSYDMMLLANGQLNKEDMPEYTCLFTKKDV